MMKYKHWFFDLDGTLARTGEDIVVAWKGALTALGRDLANFDQVFKIGPTLEKVVYELYDDATPQLVEDLMARFKPLYDESGFPNTVAYPGVPELLAAIRAATGQTILDAIRSQRICRAKELLVDNQTPLESIPLLCGWKGTATFRHYFKAQTGLSPRDWRKATMPLIGDTPPRSRGSR